MLLIVPARMAKLSDYRLREYPEVQSVFDRIFGGAKDNTLKTEMIRKELGEDQFKIYNELLRIKQMTNSVQTRLPLSFLLISETSRLFYLSFF
jgi:protease-4